VETEENIEIFVQINGGERTEIEKCGNKIL
jgi:hypothetical protein